MQLTAFQLDILQELINIGVGRAAGMLNRMVETHIQLQVPELRVMSTEDLARLYADRGEVVFSAVQLAFSGEFSGVTALLFPPESASRLVSILLGREALPTDDQELRTATLQEVGNIVLNAVLGSMANILREKIVYSPPDFVEESFAGILGRKDRGGDMVLMARTNFSIRDHLIQGEVLILFSLDSFGALIEAIDALAEG